MMSYVLDMCNYRLRGLKSFEATSGMKFVNA